MKYKLQLLVVGEYTRINLFYHSLNLQKRIHRPDFTEVVQMDGDIETIYKPIAPKKGLILTLAFMLGLMLSVFIVLVQDAIIKRKKQRYNS